MAIGVIWALLSFVMTQYWGTHLHPWLATYAPGFLDGLRTSLVAIGTALPIVNWEWSETRFPITGAELGFLNMIFCIAAYVGVSLLTSRKPFNLDRMLHRGAYARTDSAGGEQLEAPRGPWWKRLFFLG